MSTHARIRAALGAAGVLAALAAAAAPAGEGAAADPIAIDGRSLGTSAPVSDLPPPGNAGPTDPLRPRVNPLAGHPSDAKRETRTRDSVPSDPLASGAPSTTGRTPAPTLTFDGTGNPLACGGCTPPDTVGDVGPNHYVQAVNATKIAIYDKSGTLAAPAFDLGNLFIGTGGQCDNTNDGDPNVTYDPMADRWVLSQFAQPSHLCFAVSTTADPTGTYFTYEFDVGQFPDYFKVGAWPNGYYVSSNESTYAAYAFDRASMLAGGSATGIKFTGETNFLLPADVDGTALPGAGDGGLFYTFKDSVFHGGTNDRIELFELDPDFVTPANSTFGLIKTFPVAPFTYTVCGFFILNCIPQNGTVQTVDAVSEWPMHRFPYRGFGDHEALVGNFTVGGGSAVPGAAIRWFELRNTGSGWTLFQEGTHDPGGGLNRFMGSIAMDRSGNIALGYSASSATAFPSIRYATRTPGDPAGTFSAEQTMIAGSGSQTGSNRWGDYSAMTVDPVNNCDFWYTNEYYSTSSASTWRTRIGRFKEPTCRPPATDTDGDGIPDAQDACPAVAGTAPNGCPDADGDGVADAQDACPAAAGTGADGCPPNAFTLGKLKRNKKRGTAKLPVTVPGPGTLSLVSKSLKPQRSSVRRLSPGALSRPVAAAGTVKLKLKPKGKARKKLRRRGRVRVRATITYTPTGGLPASQTRRFKLKKRLRS